MGRLLILNTLRYQRCFISLIVLETIILLSLVLSSVLIKPAEYCSPSEYINMPASESFAADPNLPFQFPVNDLTLDQMPGAVFASYGYENDSPNSKEYHAAEDYHQPAGSPVYAMADGVISYSGIKQGYGWLIIIDHPDINLYSLYGHLSPSRWRIKSGQVQKGDLIGYLGDSDRNGGSKNNPLVTHLHFGIRLGSRTDYPSIGEWRWQAGWIKYCPQDLGWLQPSKIISQQEIPPASFSDLKAGFWDVWWMEFLLSAVIFIGLVTILLSILHKHNRVVLILFYCGFPTLIWLLIRQSMLIGYVVITVYLIAIIILLIRYKHSTRSKS